jgi:hypothetical protein
VNSLGNYFRKSIGITDCSKRQDLCFDELTDRDLELDIENIKAEGLLVLAHGATVIPGKVNALKGLLQ